MPTAAPPPYLDHPGPLALAHRGVTRDAPENSMAAFAAAAELGYSYVETDVRATADGECVTIHDANLDRVIRTTADDPVGTLTASRLHRLVGDAVPRLVDVLSAWPSLRLNVDVKSAAAVAPFVRAVEAAGAHDRVLVASFSDRRRRAVQRLVTRGGARRRLAASPGAAVSTALAAAVAARAPVAVVQGVLRGVDCVQLPPRAAGRALVTRRLVAAVHATGRQVHVWTVDDPGEMEYLLDLGVDGVVTDRADTLRDVLRARGTWQG